MKHRKGSQPGVGPTVEESASKESLNTLAPHANGRVCKPDRTRYQSFRALYEAQMKPKRRATEIELLKADLPSSFVSVVDEATRPARSRRKPKRFLCEESSDEVASKAPPESAGRNVQNRRKSGDKVLKNDQNLGDESDVQSNARLDPMNPLEVGTYSSPVSSGFPAVSAANKSSEVILKWHAAGDSLGDRLVQIFNAEHARGSLSAEERSTGSLEPKNSFETLLGDRVEFNRDIFSSYRLGVELEVGQTTAVFVAAKEPVKAFVDFVETGSAVVAFKYLLDFLDLCDAFQVPCFPNDLLRGYSLKLREALVDCSKIVPDNSRLPGMTFSAELLCQIKYPFAATVVKTLGIDFIQEGDFEDDCSFEHSSDLETGLLNVDPEQMIKQIEAFLAGEKHEGTPENGVEMLCSDIFPGSSKPLSDFDDAQQQACSTPRGNRRNRDAEE